MIAIILSLAITPFALAVYWFMFRVLRKSRFNEVNHLPDGIESRRVYYKICYGKKL